MLTRRDFLLSATTLAAGSFLLGNGAHLASAAEGALDIKDLGPGQWLLSGGGGNVLLLENAGHPLLIDAGVGMVAHELTDMVARRVPGISLTLINTHHHGDHIGGNFALRRKYGAGLRVVAHQKLVTRVADTLAQSILPGVERAAVENTELAELARDLSYQEFLPDETFAESLDLDTSGTPCHLQHHGPGHTDNDAVVHFPDHDLVHAGDLVFNGLWPYVLVKHGATISGWQNSLRRLREVCTPETRIIPGHGQMGGPEIVDGMLEFFEQVQEIVALAISRGLSREEVAELDPEPLRERGFRKVKHLTLTRVYDEMTTAG